MSLRACVHLLHCVGKFVAAGHRLNLNVALCPSLALVVAHLASSASTRHSRFSKLLLCTLQESINDCRVPTSVDDADAQLRACYLLAASVVCLFLMSLPTIVLLALADSFDCRHDDVVIVCLFRVLTQMSRFARAWGVTARLKGPTSESGVRLELPLPRA